MSFRVRPASLILIGGLFASSVLAQECPDIRPPESTRIRLETGTTDAESHPTFATFADAAQHAVNDWINSITSTGATICTSSQTGGGYLGYGNYGLLYDIKATPPGTTDCVPDWQHAYPYSSFSTVYQCPAGYTLQYGSYYGSSNAYYCLNTSAASCPVDPEPDLDRGGCPKTGSTSLIVGNPCHAATGNKFQKEIDYPSAGALSFARYYNSDPSTPAGSLGDQWRGEFDRRLTFSDGAAIASEEGPFWSVIYVQRPDGEVLHFQAAGTDMYAVYPLYSDTEEVLTRIDVDTFELRTPSGAVEVYELHANLANDDVIGRLTSIRFRGGRTLTVSYANAERISQVADEFGRALTFGYNGAGRLTTLTDPAGQVFTFQYHGGGMLSAVVYPDSTPGNSADNPKREYRYDDSGTPQGLTSLIDEAGNTFATWSYDGAGRVTSSQHAGGAELTTLTYNGNGTTTVGTPAGGSRVLSFITRLGKTHVAGVSEGSSSETHAVNPNGHIESVVDANGNETTYAYDGFGLEISRVESVGTPVERTTTTEWNPDLRLPTMIERGNHRRFLDYDENGNVLSDMTFDIATSVSRTVYYTRDTLGRVEQIDGARDDVTDVTTYTYHDCTTGYQCGQVDTVTNALGHVMTFNSYNAHGDVLSYTDGNGVLTTLGYDPRRRMTSVASAGETRTLAYWPTGLLKRVTLPDASYVEYTYDNAHRLTQVTDSLGNKITYTLDAAGNRTAENVWDPSNTLRRTHTRVFNALNQLYQEVDAAGTAAVTTTFSYDANGNQTGVAGPLSRDESYEFDALDRQTQSTDALGGIVHYAHDALDRVTSVIDPRGLTTSYTRDGFGSVTTQVSPDTGTTTYEYDTAGNVTIATDARNAAGTFTYDELNRLTAAEYSKNGTVDQTITFSYDAGTYGKGHLTGAADSAHSMGWTYDARGRVTNKTQSVGTVTQSVGYTYTNGNLTTLTTPSGKSIVYGYNGNRQVTSITVDGTALLNNVAYEPHGPVSGWTWGNATTTSRLYDLDQRVAEIDSAGQRTYSFDDAARITGFTDTSTGAAGWTYDYDDLDRITSGSNGTISRGWTYDANSNRLSETGSSPSTYTVQATRNRISSTTGALTRTYTYDAAGHVLTYSNVTLTYNHRGRLKTAKRATITETLVYNALGQLVKTSGGASGTVLFWYDESGRLLGEYTSSGALIQETVWLGAIPVATLRPNGASVSIYYVHADHLNSPVKVTRPSDNEQMWNWYADPFGTNAANSNPQGAGTFTYNLRFPGQWFDGQAGLHYNAFRNYDPAIGRYVESDPLGLAASLNTYAYVDGDPIGYADPWGLAKCTYSISKHTVSCTSNDGTVQRNLGPDGVWSGLQQCTNNPLKACQESSDFGPVPEGNYKMNTDTRAGRNKHWRLEPTPKKSGLRYLLGLDRAGFKLHPGTVSLGCITADKDNASLMNDYDELNKLLLTEDGSNVLTVLP